MSFTFYLDLWVVYFSLADRVDYFSKRVFLGCEHVLMCCLCLGKGCLSGCCSSCCMIALGFVEMFVAWL